ncbi:hypothetical protein BGP_2713 [Beggiatoa sp. PS]|nr:hypothetical protein BGP_2713 [Beggiatoa sp. PS]
MSALESTAKNRGGQGLDFWENPTIPDQIGKTTLVTRKTTLVKKMLKLGLLVFILWLVFYFL